MYTAVRFYVEVKHSLSKIAADGNYGGACREADRATGGQACVVAPCQVILRISHHPRPATRDKLLLNEGGSHHIVKLQQGAPCLKLLCPVPLEDEASPA